MAQPGEMFFDIGITEGSWTRLKGERGRFIKMDAEGLGMAIAMTNGITADLERALIMEFSERGHNHSGKSLREHMKVERHGLASTIRISGGAYYVEHGAPAHEIDASGRALKFNFGQDIAFRASVMHPGVTADPFVEAAMGRTNTELRFRQFSTGFFKTIEIPSWERRIP